MFKVRNIEIATAHEFVALILEEDAIELGVHPMDKIKISSSNSKFVICELEIIDYKKKRGSHKDINLVRGEIGLLENAFFKLDVLEGSSIKIVPAKKPSSLKYVKKKFEGGELSQKEFLEIMIDIVENRFSKVETTYFVIACAINKLSISEMVALTNSMVNVGRQLEFKSDKNSIVVDKHCIGGIPGNRTTLIVVPIIAAAGLKIPKTSSRAITSPAGTADTMEIFSNVEVELGAMYNLVEEENGCLIWGGGLDLSPADDIIIQVEHPLNLDSEGQMVASILSKKKSAGSDFVLIDIPVGKTAKVTSKFHALHLKRIFEKVSKQIGLDVKVIITDGSSPIGSGIGALYEAKDVLKIFNNDLDQPQDLKEKSLKMAGLILDSANFCKSGEGYFIAKQILESGVAKAKFEKIIEIQGKKEITQKAKFSYNIKSDFGGVLLEINNKLISKLAFALGAPKDKVAGMVLHKKINDVVKLDEILMTIYSDSKLRLNYGKHFFNENEVFVFK